MNEKSEYSFFKNLILSCRFWIFKKFEYFNVNSELIKEKLIDNHNKSLNKPTFDELYTDKFKETYPVLSVCKLFSENYLYYDEHILPRILSVNTDGKLELGKYEKISPKLDFILGQIHKEIFEYNNCKLVIEAYNYKDTSLDTEGYKLIRAVWALTQEYRQNFTIFELKKYLIEAKLKNEYVQNWFGAKLLLAEAYDNSLIFGINILILNDVYEELINEYKTQSKFSSVEEKKLFFIRFAELYEKAKSKYSEFKDFQDKQVLDYCKNNLTHESLIKEENIWKRVEQAKAKIKPLKDMVEGDEFTPWFKVANESEKKTSNIKTCPENVFNDGRKILFPKNNIQKNSPEDIFNDGRKIMFPKNNIQKTSSEDIFYDGLKNVFPKDF